MKKQKSKRKEALGNSLLVLLRKEPLEKITVDQICREAGVHRSTFYRYFADKFDLLKYSFLTFMIAELDPHETINSVVTMIGNDKPLFRNVLINNNDVTLLNVIINMLSEQLLRGSKEDTENFTDINWIRNVLSTSEVPEMTAKMIAGGVLTIVVDWVEQNFQTPEEEIINFFRDFMP
ncbi:TetR/AcrR family transcriptional regulator [Ligilactobacillus salivarius]|uniref:Transcriptional regulator, TetR family n=1 Tax=Ligilactobacillus salivarius TaxID=1624 RepID=A0A089QGL3_9LACO|nr:TetR/AcrR family transcriptional regulator [Ligilactobacillus salivarius]AIR10968.1 Transcriptional regulator, TetR family [Ligilactobacillus salivarius]MDM8283969.1 TetR/AcrR family transcriptional regulator [Ligilactobacillus salivarius]MYU58999.1 TetR/AcrR family transcriptional regulator [Ligilactobacillus salivarius]MYU60591.1 TetR/AcrR family transcriptional regulator [Ligilactobacillus salivarius]MYU84206.1 TetR/AcrR family transcriptional regulator [Ligilactobacillus salivarius]